MLEKAWVKGGGTGGLRAGRRDKISITQNSLWRITLETTVRRDVLHLVYDSGLVSEESIKLNARPTVVFESL